MIEDGSCLITKEVTVRNYGNGSILVTPWKTRNSEVTLKTILFWDLIFSLYIRILGLKQLFQLRMVYTIMVQ